MPEETPNKPADKAAEDKAAAAQAAMANATMSDAPAKDATGATGASPKEAKSGEVAGDDAKDDNKRHGKKGKKEELDGSSIYIKVYSPYQTFFDGDAVSISAENDTGPFDILPRHHNFMTLVNACEVVIRVKEGDGEDKKIRITRGVMHVRNNKITLFLDV